MPPPASPAELPLIVLFTMVTPHRKCRYRHRRRMLRLPLIVLLMTVTPRGFE